MNLIPCKDNCIYQVDRYCTLNSPTVITNHLGGCVHYIKAETTPKNSSEGQGVKSLPYVSYTDQLNI